MGWGGITLGSIISVIFLGGLGAGAYYGVSNTNPTLKDATNYCIQFYISLVAYFILHMIFVISSDFVEAFNIPPLNIGIYVDKLAAIRALLMVIADIFEWQFLDQRLGDQGKAQVKLTDTNRGNSPRRIGSIVSFIVMLACRIAYLIIVYKSDNKSLSVFITLCVEGFWFGVFQMSFFAIGPKYNAATSLGIHTMGNFIFFLQLILNHRAKSKPKINCLYRVRVHAWICFATSVLALVLWLVFCCCADASDDLKKIAKQLVEAGGPTQPGNVLPNQKGWIATPGEMLSTNDVWSPFWLFIIGAFAEDFSVPGILPFAFLDPEKANLVNYLTPVFFMTGALVIFFLNDIFGGEAGLTNKSTLNSGFKEWSSSTEKGKWIHSLWLLNIPKYISFFIAMFSIHGTFDDLRCIIQSRWRVMLLTMFIVVPRATLEVAGYVGVANYAIGYFAVTGMDSNDMKNGTDMNQGWKANVMHMFRLCENNGHDHKGETQIGDNYYTEQLGANDSAFMYIAFHDMLAMFCRFVYGKFAVGYNSTNSISYICIMKLLYDCSKFYITFMII